MLKKGVVDPNSQLYYLTQREYYFVTLAMLLFVCQQFENEARVFVSIDETSNSERLWVLMKKIVILINVRIHCEDSFVFAKV